MDTYWIVGHTDGIGERPVMLANERWGVRDGEMKTDHPVDEEALKKLIHQPNKTSVAQLTEILNEIDRLRDPD
ncbi:MAG: hypothetical protein ACPW60_05045 [Methylohalobius sp. ZOD2]